MQPNQVTFCLITITTASTYMQHHNYDMIVMANIIAAITIMIVMIIMIIMTAAIADYHQDIAMHCSPGLQ